MYDVLIVGSGPAGYVAAIRAAQLGLKVACVEKNSVGGTCLNVGCIPSKTLLDSTLKSYQINHHYSDHGINIDKVVIDLDRMMSRKAEVVQKLTNGVRDLLKANKVDLIQGKVTKVSQGTVTIEKDNNTETLESNNIVIASGSSPQTLPGIEINNQTIFDSEGALEFSSIPEKLVIIGAGVIGLELGSIWSRLGSQVTLLEAQKEFLPMLDKRLSRQIFKEFSNQNIKIILGAKVSEIEEIKNDSLVKFLVDEEKQEVNAEKIILAVGRKPNTGDIQFDPSPAIDELGFIEVNENCETSIRNLWAVGDVVRGPMLAHKASEEGIMVAERINGQNTSIDYDLIPNVIYTHPEIAWVGKSETQLKEESANYKSGSFPFVASGRALASAEDIGSVTVIADKETDRLLSVHVFGNSASEILQQGLVAMSSGMTSEEFGSVVVSHPTVSETIKEATLSMNSKAIHILNRKKK